MKKLLENIPNFSLTNNHIDSLDYGDGELFNKFKETRALMTQVIELAEEQQELYSFVESSIERWANTLSETIPRFENYIRSKRPNSDEAIKKARAEANQLTTELNSMVMGTTGLIYLHAYLSSAGVGSVLADITKKKLDADSILDQLKAQAENYVADEYAKIYLKQAERHSNIPKPGRWLPGLAQFWLAAGSSVFIVLMYYVVSIATFPEPSIASKTEVQKKQLPNTEKKTSKLPEVGVQVTNLMRHLLIIGLLFFLLRFLFRQYRINQHLHTIQLSKATGLSSYRLLAASLADAADETRHTLTLELARSLYSRDATGHINEKSSDGPNTSIIELTRLLGTKSPGA